ncbi:MAG: isocitrate/isopropylmalate dehydrogenase family protein [Candidatus Omnitrophota bacterium]
MAHRVTLVPGDGIGPEVTAAMRMCVDAAGADIDWEECDAGENLLAEYGTPVPGHVLESIRRNRVAIKGPVATPVGKGFRSVNVFLRQQLDLYACVRPVLSMPGVRSIAGDIDLVIFRENTEDLYAGIEFDVGEEKTLRLIAQLNALSERQIRDDAAISIKPISVSGSRRIVKAAFDYAVRNGRKKVTLVHKANIMKYSDGLFLRIGREVAREYAGRVECEDVIVDNMCMQLVQRPQDYDVLALSNLYGDIVSDLCAGLVGGLGMAPGANIGDQAALFEPVHGSAPAIAGQNLANPTATILSAVMMLRYLEEEEAASRLERAVRAVIAEGEQVTADLKPEQDRGAAVGTQEMARAVCRKLL